MIQGQQEAGAEGAAEEGEEEEAAEGEEAEEGCIEAPNVVVV